MSHSGLYRSTQKNMIAGVMGGIAERFGWNANVLRLIFVVVSLISAAFPGILVYLILWFVIPKQQPQLFQSQAAYSPTMKTVSEQRNIQS